MMKGFVEVFIFRDLRMFTCIFNLLSWGLVYEGSCYVPFQTWRLAAVGEEPPWLEDSEASFSHRGLDYAW